MTGRRGQIAFLLTCAVLVLPALVVDVPPLSDFPDHLARLHVLASAEGAPVRTFWRPAWDALPNLALDLPGVVLTPLLGVERFGRLFLVATILLWCVACRSLGSALLGRDDVRALVASALVWSEPLLLGHVGFTFGAGLALLALSAIARSIEEPRARTAAAAAALGLAAAVSHAAAAAILIAAAIGLLLAEVRRDRRSRREIAVVGLALAPCLLYLLQWWLRAASHEGVSFASAGMVLRGFASPSTGLDPVLDRISLFLLGIFALEALVKARPLVVHRGAALAAAACFALVAFFPSDLAGGIEVHGRFAVAAWVLALFAIDTEVPVAGTSLRKGWPKVAVLLLLGARTLHLAGELRFLDVEARAIRRVIAREVSSGASLGVVWFFPEERMAAADRVRALATLHVPALAVVDRAAHVPMLYALPGVQPLHYVGGLPRAHRFAASDRGPAAADLAARFDFVWLCGGPASLERDLLATGEEVGNVGRCLLIASRREELVDVRAAAGRSPPGAWRRIEADRARDTSAASPPAPAR